MSQLVFWLLGKRAGTEKSPGEAAFKSAPPASFHFIIIAPVWEPFLPGGRCRPSRGILLQRVLCVSRQILPDTSDPCSVPSPHVCHFACFCPGAILAFCCLGSTPVSTPISFFSHSLFTPQLTLAPWPCMWHALKESSSDVPACETPAH